MISFKQFMFSEMAARRSLDRTLNKFDSTKNDKPIAVLTAWRSELLDANGKPYSEFERIKQNNRANELLKKNIRQRGLSYYPVIGAGQEMIQGVMTVNKENSLMVQPVDFMDDDSFIDNIQHLLYNPTNSMNSSGPFPHTQWGAVLKLPNNPQIVLLSHTGAYPTSPKDYREVQPIGKSAKLKNDQDSNYTQLKSGPRDRQNHVDFFDKPTKQPGRMFAIRNGEK